MVAIFSISILRHTSINHNSQSLATALSQRAYLVPWYFNSTTVLQQDTDDAAPTSFAEALAAVAAREETRRRGFQSKSVGPKRGSKLKPGSSLAEPGFPGAVPGGEAERSAFWMVMEVCPRGIPF